MKKDELKYSADIYIGEVLTESDKNKLMVALSKAIKDTFGRVQTGTVVIHSSPSAPTKANTHKRKWTPAETRAFITYWLKKL